MTSSWSLRRRPLRPEALIGWAAFAAAVLLIYLSVVLGGGFLLGQIDSPNLILSIVATAVVASVAERVRERAEKVAAQRLKRTGPTPYDLLSESARELASADGGVQAPAVIARMLAAGTGVAWAQVWILAAGRLRLVATYPPDAAVDEPAPSLYEQATLDGIRSVTVSHAGRSLGVLRVREQASRPMTPVEERLLGGLAAQAGMVLETAQLRTELSLRLEQLAAQEQQLRRSRSELVLVQDHERRQLERDIHDGAQQQLVALAINLKLAQALAPSDPVQARTVIQEQVSATSEAIRTLSDLSGGLLPETLGQHGLAAAVSAATANNPIPVHVDAGGLPRHSPPIETTLYFCALEAVQNATKHADAERIDVRIRQDGGCIALEVHDDGRGLTSTMVAGSGLANIRERVDSLGGHFRVEPVPGGGTAILVTVPIPAAGAGEAGD